MNNVEGLLTGRSEAISFHLIWDRFENEITLGSMCHLPCAWGTVESPPGDADGPWGASPSAFCQPSPQERKPVLSWGARTSVLRALHLPAGSIIYVI